MNPPPTTAPLAPMAATLPRPAVAVAVAVAALVLFFHAAFAGKVPAIIVFGDSSVDPGNNNVIPTVLKSNFRPYGRDFPGSLPTGRFCNGRIATDFISEALGIKPDIPAYLDPNYTIKDFATGVSFASAGTGFDNDTARVLNVIPIWKELEYFKEYKKELRNFVGEKEAERIVGDALYILSAGTNDFLENYYLLPSTRSKYNSVQDFEDHLVSTVAEFATEIYNIGARRMSVTGLPPMGCLPLERTTNMIAKSSGCKEEYNRVALEFNVKIEAKVGQLKARLPGLNLVYTDVYQKWLEVTLHPSSYGFENVAVACCGTGLFEMGYLCQDWSPFTCSDADKYMFWDSFHPTEKTYRILAQHSLNTTLAQFLI